MPEVGDTAGNRQGELSTAGIYADNRLAEADAYPVGVAQAEPQERDRRKECID